MFHLPIGMSVYMCVRYDPSSELPEMSHEVSNRGGEARCLFQAPRPSQPCSTDQLAAFTTVATTTIGHYHHGNQRRRTGSDSNL